MAVIALELGYCAAKYWIEMTRGTDALKGGWDYKEWTMQSRLLYSYEHYTMSKRLLKWMSFACLLLCQNYLILTEAKVIKRFQSLHHFVASLLSVWMYRIVWCIFSCQQLLTFMGIASKESPSYSMLDRNLHVLMFLYDLSKLSIIQDGAYIRAPTLCKYQNTTSEHHFRKTQDSQKSLPIIRLNNLSLSYKVIAKQNYFFQKQYSLQAIS